MSEAQGGWGGQAPEPGSLIPLLAGCESAVLVGDPCQLPPTVLSAEVLGPFTACPKPAHLCSWACKETTRWPAGEPVVRLTRPCCAFWT